MVRKIIIMMCCIALFATCEVHAATYSIYDGNISSTYLDMFDSMSIPLGSDYVVFRSSQYDYHIFYGDIELNNNIFYGSGTLVTISQIYNTGTGNYYTITSSEDNNFQLNASDRLLYSSMGKYPSMYDEGYYFQVLILILLAIIVLTNIIRPIFAFTMRNRNGVIS